MTTKSRIFFYTVMFLFAVGMGAATGWSDLNLEPYAITGIVVWALIFLVYLMWPQYVFSTTTDMQRVERLLEKRKQVPIYGFFRAIANGDLQEAKSLVKRARNLPKEQRISLEASLLFEEERYAQGKELLKQLPPGKENTAYLYALICAVEGDKDGFDTWFPQVKTEWKKLIVLAESRFHEGDLQGAERYGEQVMQNVKGMQRYLLLKSRERREKQGERRKTYF